jgi:hypothetical protein
MNEPADNGPPPPPPKLMVSNSKPSRADAPPVYSFTLPRRSTAREATHTAHPDSAARGNHQNHVPHVQESTQAVGSDGLGVPAENERQQPTHPQSREGSTKSTESQKVDSVHPYIHLIRGYFWQEKPGDIPGWQPRRSLDGYFYTHLADTRRRDGDQVILRYTRDNYLPRRIFMVDQLWVWILGNGEFCRALSRAPS